MTKTYNTAKRTHIVKTRLDDEEHACFLRRLEVYGMNQSEFIREAIAGATIKPTIVATLVSDDLLAAIGKLTAEFGKIGSNLNQIARHLNEWRSPYPAMAKELQDATVDLAMLKLEVMEKVGDAIGNVQAYQL
ncbi:MAG: plasmid mobilization relaxosome protein MobC [Oscillospiraceae bacterium]|nr:plasmid mobilization relaxosome protein MobC [Oscillospiraceae bacterium]